MRLAKECKVAIIEKTYDGGVCLPERSANMSLRGKLVVFWMKHRPRHIATTQMVALMFAAIILLGALLLTLPAASRDGVSCGLRPALFTATSATCVTGLVLYDTWSQWSGFGQVVILCLIQIGGLGFMSVATLLIFLLRRKIGLQQRLMIAQSLSVNDIKGVVRLQKLVLTGSFSVEAVGAIILTLRFWPEYGFTRALRWGIFHSVSAFCNAGFDIFGAIAPGESLIEFNADPVVLLTLSALIIIGGLGFLVWENIARKRSLRKFSVYTKLVLLITAALLFSLRRAVRCPQNTKTWWHRNGPVFAACVFLTLFAVSNKIYWGNTGIELPLPAKLLELCGIFRSSGRMFYLVAACMVVYAVYTLRDRLPGRYAVLVLALFVGVQAFDLSAAAQQKRQKFADPINATVVNNDQTASLGAGHTQLLAAGEVREDRLRLLAILAGKQGLATNLDIAVSGSHPAAAIPLPGLPPGSMTPPPCM